MMFGSFVLVAPMLVVVPNLVVAAFHLVAVPNPVVVVACHPVAVPNPVVVVAHHPVAVPNPVVAVACLHLAWRHNSDKIWFQG